MDEVKQLKAEIKLLNTRLNGRREAHNTLMNECLDHKLTIERLKTELKEFKL